MISVLSGSSLPTYVSAPPKDYSSDAVAPVEPVYRARLSSDDTQRRSLTPYSDDSSLGSLLDVVA